MRQWRADLQRHRDGGRGNMLRASASLVRAMMLATFAGCLLAACGPDQTEKVAALPKLAAKATDVTVSGISSGAYMAGQFQFAHARIVSGAAIIAGGPYGCSESMFASTVPTTGTPMLNLNKAISGCMLGLLDVWGVTDPARLAEKAAARAKAHAIGAIEDVASDRVYLFTGRNDRTVVPSVVKAAAAFYAQIGVAPERIKLVTDLAAGHAFVTEDSGAACDVSNKPYVVDCDYDQAGDVFKHFYGTLNPRSLQASGRYLTFDQSGFNTGDKPNGLEESGVVYIPDDCAPGPGCRIHIAFHGCAQNQASGGDAFIRNTGFTRWADSNRIIVLFPQVKITPFNPQGCWDWWGYTGPNYLTRSAPQITAVKAMIDRLAEVGQSG